MYEHLLCCGLIDEGIKIKYCELELKSTEVQEDEDYVLISSGGDAAAADDDDSDDDFL